MRKEGGKEWKEQERKGLYNKTKRRELKGKEPKEINSKKR